MPPATPQGLLRLNRILWQDLPARASRLSPGLGSVLADGRHLSAWPLVGALAQPLALIFGLFLGWRHVGFDPPEQVVFLFSAPVVLACVAIGMQGAGVGLFLWLGYVLGDAVWAWGALHASVKPLGLLLGRLLAATLLAGALIGVPRVAAGLSRPLAGPPGGPDALPLQGLVRAGLAWLLALLWLLAAVVQSQGVYNFHEAGARTHGLMESWTRLGWEVGLLAAGAAVARSLAESAAGRIPGRLASPALPVPAPNLIRALAAVLFQSALMTLLLATFLASKVQVAIVFAVMLAVLAARALLFGRLGLTAWVTRLASLRIRLPLAFVLVWVISWLMFKHSTEGGATGFLPVLQSVILSLAVYAVLVPDGSLGGRGGRP